MREKITVTHNTIYNIDAVKKDPQTFIDATKEIGLEVNTEN
jgi:hypothetical protein